MRAKKLLIVFLVVLSLPWALPMFSRHRQLSAAAGEASWATCQVHELDMTEAERRWEEVGWQTDAASAVRYSLVYRRPIFLMVVKGELDGTC